MKNRPLVRFRYFAFVSGVCLSVLSLSGQGTVSVTGRVLERDGHPAAQVLVGVRTVPVKSDIRRVFDTPADTSASARAHAGVFARTDADGQFRITLTDPHWKPDSNQVEVLAIAEQRRSVFQRLPRGDTAAVIRLEAAPWDTLRWRILTPEGTPLRQLAVNTVVGDTIWQSSRTDSTGSVTLVVPLEDVLWTKLSVPAEYRPTAIRVGNTFRSEPRAEFRLRRVIAGMLRDVSGHPLAGVPVHFGQLRGFDSTFTLHDSANLHTDAAGRFTAMPDLAYYGRPTLADEYSMAAYARTSDGRVAYGLPGTANLKSDHPTLALVAKPLRAVVFSFRMPAGAKNLPGFWLSSRKRTPGATGADSVDLGSIGRLVVHRSATDSMLYRSRVRWLPAGSYGLFISGEDVAPMSPDKMPVTVTVGTGTFHPVTVILAPHPMLAMRGKAAPELEAHYLDGRPAKLADFLGKIVVLEFWAWSCPPCVAGMPHLAELQEKYRERGVTIVAMHDASLYTRAEFEEMYRQRIKPRTKTDTLPFPVLLDQPLHGLVDAPIEDRESIGKSSQRYGVSGWPTVYVIGADGRVITSNLATEKTTEELIEEALAGRVAP